MGTWSRVLAGLTAAVTVACALVAANATLAARRYSIRTSEDFVYVYVLAAWLGVLLVAAVGAVATTLVARRERRHLGGGDEA